MKFKFLLFFVLAALYIASEIDDTAYIIIKHNSVTNITNNDGADH